MGHIYLNITIHILQTFLSLYYFKDTDKENLPGEFVNVSKDVINAIKENSIAKSTKDAKERYKVLLILLHKPAKTPLLS